MYIPIPFFLASSAGQRTSARYHRTLVGDLFIGKNMADEYNHAAELEWIIDFTEGFHVEDVLIRTSPHNRFACEFHFRKWGNTLEDWHKCTNGYCIDFILSLRVFGYLIDAWEFLDAIVIEAQSVNEASTVSLIVDLEHLSTRIKKLPRVDLGMTLKKSNPHTLRGTSRHQKVGTIEHSAAIPKGLDEKCVTPRQFLINALKQQISPKFEPYNAPSYGYADFDDYSNEYQ